MRTACLTLLLTAALAAPAAAQEGGAKTYVLVDPATGRVEEQVARVRGDVDAMKAEVAALKAQLADLTGVQGKVAPKAACKCGPDCPCCESCTAPEKAVAPKAAAPQLWRVGDGPWMTEAEVRAAYPGVRLRYDQLPGYTGPAYVAPSPFGLPGSACPTGRCPTAR